MFLKILKLDSFFNLKKNILNFYKIEHKVFDLARNVTCAVVRFALEVEYFVYKFAKNIKTDCLLMKDYKYLVGTFFFIQRRKSVVNEKLFR